jgi:hypothetical protein
MEPFVKAGTVFTNGRVVLGGYQGRDGERHISGIGGKREGDETFWETAIRETVEELLHVDHVPNEVITRFYYSCVPQMVNKNENYILVQHSFEDLEVLLHLIKSAGIVSPIYQDFPVNVMDLVLKRRIGATRPELTHLVLLPFVDHVGGPMVKRHFLGDMSILIKSQCDS